MLSTQLLKALDRLLYSIFLVVRIFTALREV
jgi:hypothetical protein